MSTLPPSSAAKLLPKTNAELDANLEQDNKHMRHSILASVTAWVLEQDGFGSEKKLKSRTLLATIVSNPFKFPVHIGTLGSLPLHVPRRWRDFGFFGCPIEPVRLAATYMTLRQLAVCFGHQVTGKPADLMPFMNGLPHDLKAFDAAHGVNRLLVSRVSTPAPKVVRPLRRMAASSDEDSECNDSDEDAHAFEVPCENAASRADALYCERSLSKKERKAARALAKAESDDEDQDEPDVLCRLRCIPSPNSIYRAECPVHGGSQRIPLDLRVDVDGLLVSIRRSLFDLTHPRFGARTRVLSHHNAVGGMLDAVAGLLDLPVAPGPERVTASARFRVRFEF